LKGIKLKRIALSMLSALAMSSAFACSSPASQLGQTKDINFDFNSSEINNSEILSLANWIVDTRSKRSTLEGVSIVGLADKREHDPQGTAEDRAKNVKQTLDVLGVGSTTMGVIAHVYKPTIPNDKYEPTGTRAEVTLIPVCADK
jgi:outer membrane protein OmpA-like peptidoglycan-associated protein